MNENFAKEFVTKLNGKLGTNEMKIVLDELQIFTEEYDIGKKSTEIVLCDEYIPQCYKVYMVSKKIEGLSEESLKQYQFHLNDFFKAVRKPVTEITTNDIRIYLYNVQARTNISNRSLDNKRLIINGFFEWCCNEGYLTNNPCKIIKRIKCEIKERKPLTAVELELVRLACRNYREQALIEMFYSTGCRVGEMVRLNRDDVNFAAGEVYLFGKGNKRRTSYLNAKAEVMLKKYLFSRTDKNPALFVIQREPYTRITKSGLEYIVREIGKRSEINRRLYPHLIRHTTATNALNRGMDVAELKELLGHEKLDTTMIYTKVSQENVRYNHKRFIV